MSNTKIKEGKQTATVASTAPPNTLCYRITYVSSTIYANRSRSHLRNCDHIRKLLGSQPMMKIHYFMLNQGKALHIHPQNRTYLF